MNEEQKDLKASLEEKERELKRREEDLSQEVERRKTSEDFLRITETNFKNLFDNASDGIIITDVKTRKVLTCNRKAHEQLGYSREEMISMKMDDFSGTDDCQKVEEVSQQLLREGGGVFEFYHTRKDGTRVPVELSCTIVEFKGRTAFQSFVRDIRARKRMEKLKEVSFNIASRVNRRFMDIPTLCKEVYEELSKLVPVSNFFIALNNQEEETVEFPFVMDQRNADVAFQTRAKSKGFTEYVIRRRKPCLLCAGEIDELEKKKDIYHLGERKVRCFMGVPLKGEQGVIGVIGIVSYNPQSDYTMDDLQSLEFISTPVTKALEVQILQNSLIKNEKHFRTLIENSTDLITVLDRAGRILYKSPSISRVLGYSQQEVIGHEWASFLEPEDRGKIANMVEYLDCGDECNNEVQCRFKHKDGHYIYLESSFKGIRKPNEKDIIIINSRDVTERKEMEIHSLRMEMEAAERERKRIGADLHDGLGQSLTAISMYWQVLRGELDKFSITEESKSVFDSTTEMIEKAIQETRSISHNLMPNSIKQFGLESSVNEMLENIIMVTSGVELELNSELGEERFNPELEITLFRVIQELVKNSLKYARASRVIIAFSLKNNELQMVVQDDGVGFNAGKEKAEGTGLGLSTVENRINTVNGKVEFVSKPETGTRVSITVPIEKIQ